MAKQLAKKHLPAFYAAQEKVHQVFRSAGAFFRCVTQITGDGEAIEVFSLTRGDDLGFVTVRYMMPHRSAEECSVFFYYDEALVGRHAGAREFGTWDSSAELIKALMPTTETEGV